VSAGAQAQDGYQCTQTVSSFVHRICYDARSERVLARLNAKDYPYCGVPSSVVKAWLAASSKGAFFNDYVKGRYPCM
jgi:hypothetical protein